MKNTECIGSNCDCGSMCSFYHSKYCSQSGRLRRGQGKKDRTAPSCMQWGTTHRKTWHIYRAERELYYVSPLVGQPKGHFIMYDPLEGHPRRHFITYSPLQGHPRGHFITFSPLEGHPSGDFITFSPLESHPRGHFITFSPLESRLRGHFTSHFLHWKATFGGTLSSFPHWKATLKGITSRFLQWKWSDGPITISLTYFLMLLIISGIQHEKRGSCIAAKYMQRQFKPPDTLRGMQINGASIKLFFLLQ